ncbi:hypothetical protein FHU38_003491 [Saccharomonospora amisosensis]|uniref:YrhK domain-containing protein n=1 Tax=Saccharomonospora amisosensis TaxID=1128677 RepID=A0A7X5USN5_9PSEU|nr:YrhK family protein [Saccharomonospora amisosensis]NIJ13147.1 hypothetical protein [Saccharomonospora amisosensis]
MARSENSEDDSQVLLKFGHEELLVRQRYEVLSIGNDILIALWFAVGSVLFLSESTTTAGTWLFLLGSIQLFVRPVIRLSRRVHLRRLRPGMPGETARDF